MASIGLVDCALFEGICRPTALAAEPILPELPLTEQRFAFVPPISPGRSDVFAVCIGDGLGRGWR